MPTDVNQYVESIANIELHIIVIGHYPQGECILVVIYDTSKRIVLHSILIDCFCYEKKKILETTLDSYNLSNTMPLNFIIWTHPDTDHSVGLSNIISRYTDSETCIFVPDGLTWWYYIKHPKVVRDAWKIFIEKKCEVEHVNASKHRLGHNIFDQKVYKDDVNNVVKFYMEILTPYADKAFRNTEINKAYKNNDISISCIIHFGEVKVFLGGDIENNSISLIPPALLQSISFIKIPHHGSPSADKLIESIRDLSEDNEDMILDSVCTCFHSGKTNLPNAFILEAYKEISKTIALTDDNANHKNQYGICKYIYNAIGDVKKEYQGDAYAYFQM